jgi:hypothetical protein
VKYWLKRITDSGLWWFWSRFVVGLLFVVVVLGGLGGMVWLMAHFGAMVVIEKIAEIVAVTIIIGGGSILIGAMCVYIGSKLLDKKWPKFDDPWHEPKD